MQVDERLLEQERKSPRNLKQKTHTFMLIFPCRGVDQVVFFSPVGNVEWLKTDPGGVGFRRVRGSIKIQRPCWLQRTCLLNESNTVQLASGQWGLELTSLFDARSRVTNNMDQLQTNKIPG